jgi:diaminohydroxyphosphoribosylaminopyrimidine deaminase/5-amino-6-(5-phosphoribosylamino)uracil reductase
MALEGVGATVIRLSSIRAEGPSKVDLSLMMGDLGSREINEVHVEAGHKLNGSLLKAGLVDELIVYMAPMMVGNGLAMAQLGPYKELAEITRFNFSSAILLGPDLRIIARVSDTAWLAPCGSSGFSP